MKTRIHTLSMSILPMFKVNCYLVEIDNGFILIDTGKGHRDYLENELAKAGCTPDNLKLIFLTHGDFDHCGNAAYLRDKYHAPIALHESDKGMVKQGNMFFNRQLPNAIMKAIIGLIFNLDKADQFTPDAYIKAGDSLAAYGLNAEVLEIPGHSRGSIGLLLEDGTLFCGDLLGNTGKIQIWIPDDEAASRASLEFLRGRSIHTVYPGHGKPFELNTFLAES
jgi:hydroxyacylglutathione hydrolase